MARWSGQEAILAFVRDATTEGGPAFVPPADNASLTAAKANGWHVVSIKDDWLTVYPAKTQ